MLTRERLQALVHYDPDTGVFTRRVASGTAKAGERCGWVEPNGYRRMSIDGRKEWEHRLAVLYMTGELRANVDHRDGNGGNNQFRNLRDKPQRVNCENRRAAQSNNKLGVLGVYYHKRARKFTASVQVNGAAKYLGLFDTTDAAHEAYLAAKRQLHEGCTI